MNAICSLGIVPIRAEPSEKAEMVTQLLFGEQCTVLTAEGTWRRIRGTFDQYEGWVDQQQIDIADEKTAFKDVVCSLFIKSGLHYLPFGSELNGEKAGVAGIRPKLQAFRRDQVLDDALQFLHSPYLWGGRSFMGIDCSGFTQVVFKANGIALRRDASQQAVQGREVPLEDCKTGDLAFFSGPGKTSVTHVGIAIKRNGKAEVIHASGCVRIDALTDKGIVRSPSGLTHTLRCIRDVSPR